MSEESVRAQLITVTTRAIWDSRDASRSGADALAVGVGVRLVQGAVIPGLDRDQTARIVGRIAPWPCGLDHMRAPHLYWVRFPRWEGAYGRHQLSLDVVGLIATLDSDDA